MSLFVWFPSGGGQRRDWEISRALRGGPVFDVLNADQELLPGRRLHIVLATDTGVGQPRTGKNNTVFAPLHALVDVPELFEHLLDVGAKLIVDVQFPLPDPANIIAIQDVPEEDRDLAVDEAARQLWRDPGRVERAYEVLRAADAVTLGPKGFFDVSRMVGELRGAHLPDVRTAADADLFYRRFADLMLALWSTRSGWRRRVERWAGRWVLRSAGRSIAGRVVLDEGIVS